MEELGRIRSKLVILLLDQDVINLLRYLREMNVLNDEEKETVEGWMTSEDIARCLIDTVMKKGERACSVMVDYLTEKPPELWPTLGLTPTSALIKLGRIGSKLVYTLSDHDVINLLRYLREMNVLNDEEKKTVEGKTTKEDKARCLIDTVLGKGEREISLMVDYLTAKQPELCLTLGLTPTSARIKLQRIRGKLVYMLSYNDFINLLHYLRKINVLNDEEKNTVEGKTTREDKAHCLIDTVKEKGGKASSMMVDYLTEKHPELCSTLDPTKTAQIKLGRIGSKLFGMLSDHDVINLLHYLRAMNVLNDEEKKTVEGKTNREDRARCLIDTVLEKGERASSLMVDYLTKRQPELRIEFGEDPSFSSRQESPGLEPLMTSGSSGQGSLSKSELSGPVDSESSLPLEKLGSTHELGRIRSKLVDMLLDQDVINLLRYLREMNVLNDEEKETVEGWITSEGKARCLIDTVMKKGARESSVMVDYLTEKPPELWPTLGLTPTSALIKLGRIRSKLVYTLSDHDVINLLRFLREINVFNDEEKKTVEGKTTREDKARCLIYTVLGKGERASSLTVDYLTARHPELCLTLGLTPTSARIKLERIRSKLVDMLSYNDFINLLHNLWKLNVLNDEEKNTVEGKTTKEDKAHCLIDTVKEKGGKASSLMVDYLTEKHPELCSTLDPTKTAQIRFGGDPSFSIKQESPGLMSPSLPLEMHEGDSELEPLMTSGSSGQRSLSKSELSGPVDSEASLPLEKLGSAHDKVYETRSPGQDLSDKQLRVVAQTLGRRWERAAIHLGLKNEDLDDIKKEEMAEFKQRRKMLLLWKEQRPGKATAQDLLSGLEGLKVLPVKTRRSLEGLIKNTSAGLMTSGSSREGSLSKSELSGPMDCGSSFPAEMPGSSHAGEKTKRKSCNRPPGKAKAKDPLRGMKGLEDLPVKTRQFLIGLVQNRSKPVKKEPSCSSGQGSRPGELSSSLPLKMPASDGMLAGVKTERKSCNRSPGKAKAKDPLSSMKGLEDIPVETHQLLKGEKTKRKSCNLSPGKAKAKDPLRGMKGLEDLPVETQQLLKGLVKNLSKPVKEKPSCSKGQGSLPGERSSSLPLKMPASDGMLGNISKKTVVKPRKPKRVELRMVRCEFVKTVKISVIRGLLDDLLEQKVFSTEDKVSVMENERSRKDRARCLIDMVIGKGEKASRIMIASMKKKYNDLCSTLGLISSPAGVGHVDDKTLVKQRKQNKGNGGRKRNGSKSEEVAHKKPCTVDVSDSITETHSTGQTLTDKELMNVADTLGQEWEPAAIHLELTTKDLDDIKAEHRPVAMQKLMMLVRWKGRRPPGKATAQDLLNCLTDLKHLPVETHQLLTELMKCHSELDGSVQRKQ
ncbi:uncharacterized protein LOC130405536 isoform X5 [Gadus chalcogrammus]|uniref:uncharacterized protein LOC130405536 isoform X5 n=1 Tax=Gadus chalcogrammus TaxID=1042646 RepID=UPI0024C4BABB|nr:uncharacterized protein LOC130405536 isoform X5 [Gadus chalcogrammus]